MMVLLAALCSIFCSVPFETQQMGNKQGPCSREFLGEHRTRGRKHCQNSISAWHDCGDDTPQHASPAQREWLCLM